MPNVVTHRAMLRYVFVAAFATLAAVWPSDRRSLAQESSPAAAMVNLVRSGRIPKERLGNVMPLICDRGDAADLAFVLKMVLEPDALTREVRLASLEGLADAARTRKVRPSGDLSGLAAVFAPAGGTALASADVPIALAALRLAGLWHVEALSGRLKEMALSEKAPLAVRSAALEALASLEGPAGREAIDVLTAAGQPTRVRVVGVATLAGIDLAAAAERAAGVLPAAGPRDDLAPLAAAFLERRQGADTLAAALSAKRPPPDAAKLLLRAVYALGRSDAALVAVLSEAAGISASPEPPSEAELKALVADVLTQGDAARGEAVFRRADLGCFKCHALSKAGGEVGPDLSPVGATSPPDYLVQSILVPDLAVKEHFATTTVLTADGKVYQGIVTDKDDQRITLKDPTGKVVVIPLDDIEARREGGSLMPKGLAALLTRAELVDLVKFLFELGKPGPHAIRTAETIQRWRVLRDVPDAAVEGVPDDDALRRLILEADPARWQPAYAMVAGHMPLDEVSGAASVVYLQGDVDVTEAGPIELALDSIEGVTAWIEEKPLSAGGPIRFEAEAGRHRLTLRVDLANRESRRLRVELVKPDGSSARFTAVGGP